MNTPANHAARDWSDLGARAASGLVLASAGAAAAWFGGPWLAAACGAAVVAMSYEWARMSEPEASMSAFAFSLVGSLGAVFASSLGHLGFAVAWAGALAALSGLRRGALAHRLDGLHPGGNHETAPVLPRQGELSRHSYGPADSAVEVADRMSGVTEGAAPLPGEAGVSPSVTRVARATSPYRGGTGVRVRFESAIETAGGALYVGLPTAVFLWLRDRAPEGRDTILAMFAIVWATDISAYFGGKLIGGPRVASGLSPNKTWSGIVAGVLAGALAGYGCGSLFAPELWCAWSFAGALVGFAGLMGDLFESFLKRRFGVKDASRIIPGHGGVLDRIDSLIAASLLVGAAFAFAPGLARLLLRGAP